MKVVILCGGKGTRISEETKVIPKPMVKIGNKPILWHIMKIFSKYKYNQFVLALGYKSQSISNNLKLFKEFGDVKAINTGLETLTGGRLLRLKKYLDMDDNFLMTYGDGVSNVNLSKLIKFHIKHKKIATITAVHPPVRFGELILNNDKVKQFKEKPQAKAGWVNGGFFALNKKVFNFLKNDKTIFEREPLEKLSKTNQLMAFKHKGFWQCMDTLRDKQLLNKYFRKNPLWLK
ncbi:sugar phosphate nucleotidyltransferase [Candidatus Pelagibacter bacterium]|nr:sugar phosphate nucleotidyltransferase [Candidatus Pelagibacter bacterium]MDA9625115.1 sugar phosphate nucleotidyltransferase [Candidatus Pelagibacter bacterium]